MNRRKFLRDTSITALAATLIPTAMFGRKENETGIPSDEEIPLEECGISFLSEKMKNGSTTSEAIVNQYLDRISKMDKNGVSINAIIELNPDAVSIAQERDKERKAGKVRGILHGIPVLIKDNIDTADKMMTTAGALAMEGNKAKKDAFIVQKLREAGAVILGKTNLSEWANFRSTHSTSGWSSRGGQTKNPYALNRNPCGSSSGSAAAVSAGFCTVSIGSETDGSITAPASYCGIVGMKPTVGLWSRSGIIPISETQDTAGPMGQTVTDVSLLLAALSAEDTGDAKTKSAKRPAAKDFSEALKKEALKGKRIGIEKSSYSGNEKVKQIFLKAVEAFKNCGAEIVEVDLLEACASLSDPEFTVLKYEFKNGLEKYLAQSSVSHRSLSDIIRYNQSNEKKAMPYFSQELLETCASLGDLNTAEYKDALKKSLGAQNIIDDLMKKNSIDLIAGITIGPAHCTDLIHGDYGTGYYFCSPAAMAGYPHITVPMGLVNEMPVGLSMMSGAWTDAQLLGYAYAYEQASPQRAQPKFLASV